MKDDDGATAFGFFAASSIALIVCFGVHGCTNEEWEFEAIKHGAAYYHPETGEFTWKGEE